MPKVNGYFEKIVDMTVQAHVRTFVLDTLPDRAPAEYRSFVQDVTRQRLPPPPPEEAKTIHVQGNYNDVHDNNNVKLDDKEKEMVGNLIGTYAFSKEEGQYPELFAESWTKFICESLSDDCESFAKNPVDILKSMPKEFQSLLEKISQVEMYHLFKD